MGWADCSDISLGIYSPDSPKCGVLPFGSTIYRNRVQHHCSGSADHVSSVVVRAVHAAVMAHVWPDFPNTSGDPEYFRGLALDAELAADGDA